MSSRKINKLRYSDVELIKILSTIFIFLEILDIKSASEAADEASTWLEEFCHDCGDLKDDCCCGRRGVDLDYHYDSWKDSQYDG